MAMAGFLKKEIVRRIVEQIKYKSTAGRNTVVRVILHVQDAAGHWRCDTC